LRQCHRQPPDGFGRRLSGRLLCFCQQLTDRDLIPPLNNTQTSFCPGGSSDYVYLQVFYAMPLVFPVWLPTVTTSFQGKTVKLVSAAAAFKNEPYQSSYSGC
jgi:hypothetical protein